MMKTTKKKMICCFCLLFFPIIPTLLLNRKQTKVRLHRSLQSPSPSSSSFSTAVTKLTASDGGASDEFGDSNAVSISNNRIVVGAYGYDTNRGAVYLFGDSNDPASGRSYSQLAFLTASDDDDFGWSGAIPDHFGDSVAINGDIIVVGATYASTGGGGAVYIYRIFDDNNIITISPLAKLTASNGMAGDLFGSSVSTNGNIILVGAFGVEKNGSDYVGSAYLFGNPTNDLNSPEWTQLQIFQPNDLTADDSFGISMAMDQSIAVIGTDANAVYVFVPFDSSLSSSWTHMAKLTGSPASGFGRSVAVAGNWIVVGADRDDNTKGITTGAAFVFTKTSSPPSSWTQTNTLLANDGTLDYNFGSSVSISKDASTIVVGAENDGFNATITNLGAAYLFRTTNTTTSITTVKFSQNGKFVAADRDTDDELGTSIAIENNIVVVGASGDDSKKGSVYILDTGFSSTTTPTAKPVASPSPTPVPTTVSPKPQPTNPPISTNAPTNPENDSSTAPTLPMTENSPTSIAPVPTTTASTTISPSPMIPTNADLPTDSPSTKQSTNVDSGTVFTPGVIVGLAAIVGVVLIVFGILNYGIKVRREAREQQQQHDMNTTSENFAVAAPIDDDTPIIMAEDAVIVPSVPRPVNDITLEVTNVFLDPAQAVMAPLPPESGIDNLK